MVHWALKTSHVNVFFRGRVGGLAFCVGEDPSVGHVGDLLHEGQVSKVSDVRHSTPSLYRRVIQTLCRESFLISLDQMVALSHPPVARGEPQANLSMPICCL